MDGLEMILTRRSIRKYENKPVDDETVKKILHAGMSAPSAKNNQPWEFLVVKQKEKLLALSTASKYWKMLEGAAFAIIVLGNTEGYSASAPEFFVQDCSNASQNILLAAHALGLGGVWLGLYPKEQEIAEVRRLFNIPGHVYPVCVLSLGYPVEPKTNVRPYREDKVFYDSYK